MRRLAWIAALALLPASPLGAQQGTECELVQNRHVNAVGQQPNVVAFVSGPLLVTCSRGEQLRSDSAVVYQGTHEVQLYGRVDFQDPTRALTSDYATYNSQTGRLYARGSVVFTDKERGSTLRGPELEYFRQQEGRPEAQMIATGRPHLTLVPKQEPGRPRRDPLDVDGDRITTVGNRYMSAEGTVVIRGKEILAHSAEAFYDADQDRLELRRNADVAGDKFTLRGDFIETTMKEGKVQRVLARTDAHLVSDRLKVDGPLLTLFFADDQLQRLVAGPIRTPGMPVAAQAAAPAAVPTDSAGKTAAGQAAAAPTPARPAVPRSVAYASGFRMVADSLEAILPAQRLQRVNAIGTAHAEAWDTLTAGPDGTRASAVPAYRPPARDTTARAGNPRGGADRTSGSTPDSASIAGALARVPRDRDVVDADTIIGHFIQVDTATSRRPGTATTPPPPARGTVAARPGAPADTSRPEPKTELDRMQAFGSARALYRLKPKQDSTSRGRRNEKAGINYVIGDTIDLQMAHGEVETAHVRGLKRGIYLDPEQLRGDSAAARPATPANAPAAAAPGARPTPAAPVARPTGKTPTAGTSRAMDGALPPRIGASAPSGSPQPGQAPPPPQADALPAAEVGR